MTGFAVTIDGTRVDYGLSPRAADGTCSCAISVPFSGGQHTIVVTAYNGSTQVDSDPYVVGPTANPGGPYTGQAGTALAADGSASSDPTGSIVSYAWDWGDGTSTTSSSATPSHTYAALGTFSIVLTVLDNGGASATASTTATIGQTVDQPPVVNFLVPANGSTFTAPATINLAAAASDPDGTVTRVDFYANGVLIGGSTTAPYALNWLNVAPGTYTLTAVATDNSGSTSAPANVGVTVAAPPPLTIQCPVPSAASPDGNPVVVKFAPAVSGGSPPVTTTCSPSPGSLFPVGVTPFCCRATDVLSSSATCQSAVTVSGCAFTVTPTSLSIGPAGGAAVVSITTTGKCLWTARSNVGWIAVTSGASSSGNGTIRLLIRANLSATPRTGTLAVAGHSVTVNQLGVRW